MASYISFLQLVIIFNALFVETLFWYTHKLIKVWIGLFMVFNATFINISVISWRSVLLVGEPGVPGENHPPAVNH